MGRFKYCLGRWSKRASLVREKDFGAVVPGLGSVISWEYHVHITHVLSAKENCNKTTIFKVKDSKNHYFSEIF
jgi:hypothetical protein